MKSKTLAPFIDHTLLKPDLDTARIKALCAEALAHQFAAVCVPPYFVADAAQALTGSTVKVATVIGFPYGYSATVAKVEEIKRAIDEGADEMDVVINLAAVKSENWNFVRNDIDRMTTACHLKNKAIKVIIESGLLTDGEMDMLCAICNEIKPDFVKTSTGVNGPGATQEAVAKLRKQLDPSIKIKASGGIRTADDAKAMLKAGADRLGSSSGVVIVEG